MKSPWIIPAVILLVILASPQIKKYLEDTKKKGQKSPFDAGMLDPSVYDCPNGICTDGGTFDDRTNG